MHWIREVETAKSIDELVTRRSLLGRNAFPDSDLLDAMIASALRRLLDKRIHFRKKKVSIEERIKIKDAQYLYSLPMGQVFCQQAI